MTNAVIFNRLQQLLLDLVLSYYVLKLHLVQNSKMLPIYRYFYLCRCCKLTVLRSAAQNMPRILAFDYGTKRIGLAVTDPFQIIATGLDTVHPKDALEYLKKYLAAEQVEAFVFGDPIQMDGSPSYSAQHVKGFARTLRKTYPEIPQYWIDERYTSVLAQRTVMQSGLKKQDRQNKERVDTIAATIILQYFMEQPR
jgi:putative Holliday junction resolvase